MPQPVEMRQPESAADLRILVATSPSAAAVLPQLAEIIEPESAMEVVVLAAALQPERTVMP